MDKIRARKEWRKERRKNVSTAWHPSICRFYNEWLVGMVCVLFQSEIVISVCFCTSFRWMPAPMWCVENCGGSKIRHPIMSRLIFYSNILLLRIMQIRQFIHSVHSRPKTNYIQRISRFFFNSSSLKNYHLHSFSFAVYSAENIWTEKSI